MEHVEDEAQAFGELRRVIKPDGKMIFSVPVTMETETIEIEGICSDEDREKYYGQKDHVRLTAEIIKNVLNHMDGKYSSIHRSVWCVCQK